MTAVVVEVQGSCAAALFQNGQFVKIPNMGYEIGQLLRLEPTATHRISH